MQEHDRKQLEEFLLAIGANLPGYKNANFAYLAAKNGEAFHLVKGRLLLGVVPGTRSQHFESQNLKAGIWRFDELGASVKSFIEGLLTGVLKLPNMTLQFPPEQGRSHSVWFSPFHSDGAPGTPMSERLIRLHIRGDRRGPIQSPELDWELKAADTPFDSIQDLCQAFSVGSAGDTHEVEISAFNVAAVSSESRVQGANANLVVQLALGLDREKCSIGYRRFERNVVVERRSIEGKMLAWSHTDHFQRGEVNVQVTAGAVLHCVARFDSRAQQQYWVLDPTVAQNPFRAVHEAFDPKFEVLQDLVQKAQQKGSSARDLEIAVAWLLWSLGFSVTHIGGTPKTSNAPDLVAATPLGNIAVIECTTGILREDNKLPHLVERAEKVRQSLNASGNQHLKVLPVILTTKTREEVKAESEQAHKMGVLVATREVFGELINRTLLFPDANRLYAEAEEALRRIRNPSPFGMLGK